MFGSEIIRMWPNKILGSQPISKEGTTIVVTHLKDLDGISARGAETVFSSTTMRSACILQT